MYNNVLSEIIHQIGQSIYIPVLIVLLFMVVVAVLELGSLVAELFLERRHDKEDVLKLCRRLDSMGADAAFLAVEQSGLLGRQKRLARRLAGIRGASESGVAAYAQKLLAEEDAHYRRVLMPTDLIAKLGPMFGLLCTLIPLGPGIVALGQGDIAALSSSIGVAFDGTIVGVASAAVSFAISYLRAHWYETYTATNESVFEILADKMIGEEGGAR